MANWTGTVVVSIQFPVAIGDDDNAYTEHDADVVAVCRVRNALYTACEHTDVCSDGVLLDHEVPEVVEFQPDQEP